MNVIVFSIGFQAVAQKNTLILRIRSRIEELEKRFLKPSMLSWTRIEKWNMILRGNVGALRKKYELRRFRYSITVHYDVLIETICNLYGEFSDIAAHNINYPVSYDETSIIEMLTKFGITSDKSIKLTLYRAILRPIP